LLSKYILCRYKEADRRNKKARAEEAERLSWYQEADRVRSNEVAKMNVESGGRVALHSLPGGVSLTTWPY
jgi:hypothetical protein